MSLRARCEAAVGRHGLEVDLTVEAGAPLALVGPNGAGKTSLLAALLGALPITRGHVAIGGVTLCDTAKGRHVPVEARRIGFVPQDLALFPHLTVRDNVAFGASGGATSVDGLLADLALGALADRLPSALSGGERQRVALARALAVTPRALLLDEPLAALDLPARAAVRAFLAAEFERLALPTIVVTHDPLDAKALAAHVAVLEAGRITQYGTWAQLVAAPATPFVAAFVANG